MPNLLKETKEVMSANKQNPADIIFIGTCTDSGHSCTWQEFTILADREYDSGHGGQEVADDLIIVFRNGEHLSREEYDGSEWWQYHKNFRQPAETKPIKSLFAKDCWESLKEINS